MSSLFDVGGYRLACEIVGTGTPPVVFIAGLGDAGDVWNPVIDAMRAGTAAVTYDRPGLGSSDPLPKDLRGKTRSYGDSAAELGCLLHESHVDSPSVVVGHSIGALVAMAYASRCPAAVAGLVTVDATDPSLYLDVNNPQESIVDGDLEGCATFDWVKGLREFESLDMPRVPAIVLSSAVGRWATAKEPELYRPFTLAEVDARWQAWQRRLAQTLGAALSVAPTGGHYVHTELPHLTASAIDAVVQSARRGDDVVEDQLGPGAGFRAAL